VGVVFVEKLSPHICNAEFFIFVLLFEESFGGSLRHPKASLYLKFHSPKLIVAALVNK
jgi:hypothetical protein